MAAPKRRLARVLDLEERRGLARAMLADVIAALRQAGAFGRILLVSRADEDLGLGLALGAEPLRERGRTGYRSAAAQAAAVACGAGARGLLVIPSDVPLVSPAELRTLAAESRRADVVIGSDRAGGGTNALLVCPPDAIPFLYGPASCEAHRRAGEAVRLRVSVLRRPGLELDLDRPSDLRRALAAPAGTEGARTREFLHAFRLAGRL